MTAATDDELLIITGDSVETEEIKLMLDEEPSSNNEDIISFGDDEPSLEITEENSISVEETDTVLSEGVKEGTIDLNFDLWWESNDLTVEDMFNSNETSSEEVLSISDAEESISSEESIIDFSLDLDADWSNAEVSSSIEEETESLSAEDSLMNLGGDVASNETSEIEEVRIIEDISEDVSLDLWESLEPELDLWTVAVAATWVAWIAQAASQKGAWDDSATWDDDVNTILEATIKKLLARKQQIEDVKEKTVNQIAELKDQIKNLQGEVKWHNSDVKKLDTETDTIDDNVAGLEKMKMKV